MKKEVWQAHVDAYSSSKQSVMAYANHHGLVYSQMLYWTRKLRNEPKKNNNPEPAFVAIEIKNTEPTPSALGILEFPSGIKLHIHNAELLNNIPNLWTGKP